jgi:hypothetical protein
MPKKREEREPVDVIKLIKQKEHEEKELLRKKTEYSRDKVFGDIPMEERKAFAKELERTYSNEKLVSDEYLFSCFDGMDLKYLKLLSKECQSKKYPKSPLLNEYLFLATINHKLHIAYVEFEKKYAQQDKDVLDIINKNSDKLRVIEHELIELRDKKEGEKSVFALHKDVVEAARKFIRENIGEFTFKCKCGEIVSVNGVPHWALYKADKDGVPYVFVWSSQLWTLVQKNLIPVHYMAFALDTSIEGLKFTCDTRGDKWIDIDQVSEEDKLKQLQDEYNLKVLERNEERVKKLGENE